MEEFSIKKLKTLVESRDIDSIKEYMNKHNLVVKDGKIVPEDKSYYKKRHVFWDQRQHARKILLNSLYGSILNEACRFFDQRVGQSVTLSGRSIVRHMNSKINEIITGQYTIDGDGIIYIDTDSSYFSIEKMLEKTNTTLPRDEIIKLYDNIGDITNESFPEFMNKTFNTGLENGAIIAAGREIVGSRGLFIKKKKYAILVYDKEGIRYDKDGKPGKLKAMGLDLKRSDTPKIMQDFLEEILIDLLTDHKKEEIFEKIKNFRVEFHNIPAWEKGTPKKVNSLTEYSRKLSVDDSLIFSVKQSVNNKKIAVPGHVRASLNWNTLRSLHQDRYSMEITDGTRIIVCKLKKNDLKMTSIAYPVDEINLPQWFKDLPFDDEEMEKTIIDMKLDNLLGVLNWDMRDSKIDTTFNDLFD